MKKNSIKLAQSFAEERHYGQVRKGSKGIPYFEHIKEVVELVKISSTKIDDSVIIASYLHDIVEDCKATRNEIKDLFGRDVIKLVEEMTDKPSNSETERWSNQIMAAKLLSVDASLIKLADKISNLESLFHDPPLSWNKKKITDYTRWGQKVVENLPYKNSILLRRFNKICLQIDKKLSDIKKDLQ